MPPPTGAYQSLNSGQRLGGLDRHGQLAAVRCGVGNDVAHLGACLLYTSPPQIPNRSSWSMAHFRHCSRTSHFAHTRLASRVEPPFSGKNASGSVCAHNALCCQDTSPSGRNSPHNSCHGSSAESSTTPHMRFSLPIELFIRTKLHTCHFGFVKFFLVSLHHFYCLLYTSRCV